MRLIFLIVCVLAIGTFELKAQYLEGNLKYTEPEVVCRLGLLLPAIVVEGKIAKNTTLNAELSTGFSYSYTVINGRSNIKWGFYPYLTLEPRFYGSLERRKVNDEVSGNFLGGYLGVPIAIGLTYPIYSAGAVYGLQKNLGKKGFWNFEMGLGLDGYNKEISYGVIFNLRLGYILN